MILVVNKKKCVFFLVFRNFSVFFLISVFFHQRKEQQERKSENAIRVFDDVTYCCAQMSIDFDYV